MGRWIHSIFDCVIHPHARQKDQENRRERPHETVLTTTSSTASVPLPSTLTGPPTSHYVPPGLCQFNETPIAVPLLKRTLVSENRAVLRFGLPNDKEPLNLSTCACVLAKSNVDGEDVVRPYTPISTNHDLGYFDLLVKNYGAQGKMSRHLHDIPEGSTDISFFHIPFNVKIQAPDFLKQREILMIAGGTGITPMIQALHVILGFTQDGGDHLTSTHDGHREGPNVTLLYGCRTRQDILGQEMLDNWKQLYPNKLQVKYILSQENTDDSTWTGLRGRIGKPLIEEHKKDDQYVWICGPPPMYNALSGPREESDVSGVLAELGYTTERVLKL